MSPRDHHPSSYNSSSPSHSLKINKDNNSCYINYNSSSPSHSLKINKDNNSCYIKKPSSFAEKVVHQQRHPVIIYTHSPKIIHTNPRDFMALVQKLTGLSPSDHEELDSPPPLPPLPPLSHQPNTYEYINGNINDEKESNSSNNSMSCNTGDNNIIQVDSSSCSVIPHRAIFDLPNISENEDISTQNINHFDDFGDTQACFDISSTSEDLVCSAQSLCSYTDSLFFTSTIKDLPDF